MSTVNEQVQMFKMLAKAESKADIDYYDEEY